MRLDLGKRSTFVTVVLFNKDVEVSVFSVKQTPSLGGWVDFWWLLLLNSATCIKEKPGG